MSTRWCGQRCAPGRFVNAPIIMNVDLSAGRKSKIPFNDFDLREFRLNSIGKSATACRHQYQTYSNEARASRSPFSLYDSRLRRKYDIAFECSNDSTEIIEWRTTFKCPLHERERDESFASQSQDESHVVFIIPLFCTRYSSLCTLIIHYD